MATYDPEQTGNYYILGDSHAEMLHLLNTDRYFNSAMGGLLPEQAEQALGGVHSLLDVACGPGGWALEVAQIFPDVEVTGIDISQGMIDYANVQARASQLENAHFQVANAMEPFAFPDNSFDLVNARHLEGVIPTAAWHALLKEMVRVTRPGGTIRLVSSEWGVTNGLVFETLQRLDLGIWLPGGLNHAPDDRNVGIAAKLGRYLSNAGDVNIQERPSLMDISAGAEFHAAGIEIFNLVYEMIEPFFLAAQVITPQELKQQRQRLALEMSEDSFRGIIYTLTVWGQKP
jgi:SAM-dependent methyltransferase